MAFWEGIIAGFGIAIPVGAIAVLIIETAIRRGFLPGFAAGAGAATADFLFGALAALAGEVLSALLSPYALWLKVLSGLALISIGLYGLRRMQQNRARIKEEGKTKLSTGRTYLQFLGLTLLNPLTIAYFASLIIGGSTGVLQTTWDRIAFVFGAGAASFSWQTLLAATGSIAHRRLSPRAQNFISFLGYGIVLGLGIRVLVR